MAASIALLILGAWAVLGVVNARRPARTWWLMGGSWIAAWVATELAPHLVLAGTALGVVLVALGALQHTVGWIGLAGLVVADAIAIPLIVRALKSAAALEEIVGELDPHDSVGRDPRRDI